MDLFSLIEKRRSIRIYESRPVEDEKLNRILEAINAAPSAGNLQAYDVVVVRDQDRKQALTAAAYGQSYIAQAPVTLIFCAVPERSTLRFQQRGAELYCIQDATIAASYGQLAITALDLSSVWIGSFDPERARTAINAPASAVPVTILPIGYPAETPPPGSRRSLDELVYEEEYRKE